MILVEIHFSLCLFMFIYTFETNTFKNFLMLNISLNIVERNATALAIR